MQTPRISVIMLTYNREALVGRAIESILSQTMRGFEFIIVDNGSTDQSGIIAEGYATIDLRIRTIHRNRGSIGSGRNAGLDVARGEYITFIDDDDWVESDFLEFLYGLAVENGADVSICGAVRDLDGEEALVGVCDGMHVMEAEDAIIALMWRKRYNTGFPTKLISRTLFQGIRFTETGRYDDISLMYKILAKAATTVSYGLPKYHVYRHAGNNSSATTKDGLITWEYLDAYRQAYRERTEWLCERFPKQSDYWWYFDWSFQISMVNKIISNNLKDCECHLDEMRSELALHQKDFLNSRYLLEFEKGWMEKYIDKKGSNHGKFRK